MVAETPLITDEEDYDVLQQTAEFADLDCPVCGDPLALDGACESCGDSVDDDVIYEIDDIDDFDDEGGEG